MAGNAVWFAQAVLVLATTYLIHSTILLGSVWLLFKLSRTSSHTLEEKLWRLAGVLGLLTGPLQLFLGWPTQWEVVLSHDRIIAAESDTTPPLQFPDAATFHALPQSVAAEPTRELPLQRSAAPSGGAAAAHEINAPANSRREASVLGSTNVGDALSRASSSQDAAGSRPLPVSSPPDAPWDLASGIIVLTAMALIGFTAGGFTLAIFQSRLLSIRFADARALDTGPARRTLERLLKRHAPNRRVRLLATDACDEPAVFGLMHWTIVLPANIERRLYKDELQALLAHELAHLVRGDLWWLWIGRLLCTCLAFQPLNFLASRRWRQATEYLCDEWALRCGVTGLSLARCLTRIAQWRLGRIEGSTSLAAAGSKSTLILRVERLVEQRDTVDVWSSPQRRRWFALLASLAAVTFFAVAPRIAMPSPGGPNQQISVSESGLGVVTHPNAGPAESCDEEFLNEELRGLDIDLRRASRLLDRIPQDRHLHQIMADLRGRAQQIRDRWTRVGSFVDKESE